MLVSAGYKTNTDSGGLIRDCVGFCRLQDQHRFWRIDSGLCWFLPVTRPTQIGQDWIWIVLVSAGYKTNTDSGGLIRDCVGFCRLQDLGQNWICNQKCVLLILFFVVDCVTLHSTLLLTGSNARRSA